MNSSFRFSALALLTTAILLCSCQSNDENAGTPVPGIAGGAKNDSPEAPSDPEACTRGLPQYNLAIRVASMEMIDEIGLQLGFPASAIEDPLVNMTASFKRGRMALVAEASNPLEGTITSTSQGNADVVHFTVSAEVNLKTLSIEPRYFYTTPLAEVATKALGDGIKKLGDVSKGLPWKGVLLGRADSLAVLGAGWAQGVEVGDRFAVYNVERYWSGQPCASQYLGELRVPETPVVTVEVTQVPLDGNTSFARVLTGSLGNADVGAEVVVQALKRSSDPKISRALRKRVRVAQIQAETLKLPDSSEVDLTDALGVLVRDQLSTSLFYLAP